MLEQETPNVGQRIEVLWEDDSTYYAATVTNYRLNGAGRYEFFLQYNDGDSEWLDFGRAAAAEEGGDGAAAAAAVACAADGAATAAVRQVQWRLSESEKREPKRVRPRRNGARQARRGAGAALAAAAAQSACGGGGVLEARSLVYVRWEMTGGGHQYYPGVVSAVNDDDGTYDIRYKDGDRQGGVEREIIKTPAEMAALEARGGEAGEGEDEGEEQQQEEEQQQQQQQQAPPTPRSAAAAASVSPQGEAMELDDEEGGSEAGGEWGRPRLSWHQRERAEMRRLVNARGWDMASDGQWARLHSSHGLPSPQQSQQQQAL
jgi:hypothetical protein